RTRRIRRPRRMRRTGGGGRRACTRRQEMVLPHQFWGFDGLGTSPNVVFGWTAAQRWSTPPDLPPWQVPGVRGTPSPASNGCRRADDPAMRGEPCTTRAAPLLFSLVLAPDLRPLRPGRWRP